MHISANFGKKISVLILLNLQDSGFSEEEEEEERNMTRNRDILARSIGGTYNTLNKWIARHWPVNDDWSILKAWLSMLSEFGGIFCVNHVRLYPCHPYIECSQSLYFSVIGIN